MVVKVSGSAMMAVRTWKPREVFQARSSAVRFSVLKGLWRVHLVGMLGERFAGRMLGDGRKGKLEMKYRIVIWGRFDGSGYRGICSGGEIRRGGWKE